MQLANHAMLKILGVGRSRIRIPTKASIDTCDMSFDDRPCVGEGN
jgi:hypothetical protein